MELLLTAKQKKERTVYGRKVQSVTTIKDVDPASRTVTGFFNSLYYFDSDWDVSLPGSFNKSIADRGPESQAIAKFKMLRDHNWEKTISRPHVLEQKTVDNITGLYFESKLSKSTAGRDALIDYQEEIIDNHSFGFAYGEISWLKADTDAYKRVFDLLVNPEDAQGKEGLYAVAEYVAFEGSAVAYGANELTPFLGMKSGENEENAARLAKLVSRMRHQLEHGKQSDEHLQAMDMQMRQLEQAIKNFEFEKPLKKDTQSGPSNTEKTQSRKSLILNLS